MTARTFISVYRYDPVRVLFVRRVLPVLLWISLFGALLVPVLLLVSFQPEADGEARTELTLLVAGMGVLLLTVPAVLQWFIWHTRRDIFDTQWHVGDIGIERIRGGRRVHLRWTQIRGLDQIGCGRLQIARVRSDAGNLWFDAAMVERSEPPPGLRAGMARMTVLYPDGRERLLTIESCELCLAIAERLATQP